LVDVAGARHAGHRLHTPHERGGIRGIALEVGDDAHAVAPLAHGLVDVGGQQPEAAESPERERDERDGAHRDAPAASQIPQRLGDEEAQHYPSSFTSRPPSMVSVRRRSAAASRAWWVAKSTVVPARQMSFITSMISTPMFSSRFPVGSSARRSAGLRAMARA